MGQIRIIAILQYSPLLEKYPNPQVHQRTHALGLQFRLEGFGALLAEKGFAVIVRHCGALRDRCFAVS